MAANRMEPRRVIGTVSAAEFLVALGASIGFLASLGSQQVAWEAAAVLLVGGLFAAPIAAWLVRHVDHRVLGTVVSGMIFFYNADRVLSLFGVSPEGVIVARLAIVVVFSILTLLVWRSQRARRAAALAAPVTAPAAVVTASLAVVTAPARPSRRADEPAG